MNEVLTHGVRANRSVILKEQYVEAMEAMSDSEHVRRVLREVMLSQDLSHKQLAERLSRSVATVKRALKGNVGERTAYKILKEFGYEPAPRIEEPAP